MYSDVGMEVPKSYFEKIIDEMKEAKGVHYDTELDANDLKELAEKFKAVYKEAMKGEEFPQDPKEMCIRDSRRPDLQRWFRGNEILHL